MHDRIVKLAVARQEQLLSGFSAEERALLIDFLARMRAQVEALAKGAAGTASDCPRRKTKSGGYRMNFDRSAFLARSPTCFCT